MALLWPSVTDAGFRHSRRESIVASSSRSDVPIPRHLTSDLTSDLPVTKVFSALNLRDIHCKGIVPSAHAQFKLDKVYRNFGPYPAGARSD